MRERIRCRDWSGGERIFYTDFDKWMRTLLKTGIFGGLFEMILGVFISSEIMIVFGMLLVIFSLAMTFWYGNQGGFNFYE
jgi:hypothetical protein